MAGLQIRVQVCGECEHKAVSARGVINEPLVVCNHVPDDVISLPDSIEIISANTGEVLFIFEVPKD